MPVSKKRKKSGKKVQRKAPPVQSQPEGHPPADTRTPLQKRMGKPSNPFVAAQPQHRGAQRGR